ncbi:hypothetical protein BST83_17735 [Polaribacter filamentus]|jgi:hypothetical protein|uniref:Uncharacterized protein n=1 Tax=Polaribacter filamentus TaxID=53483 RepID=A0A2S7KKK9_9FLAO|nr:HopJ type III effector protein [Polaribacter filamentus]PQB03159.1 hypothetical protein BST83_17735 [Polaribacter filamentus]
MILQQFKIKLKATPIGINFSETMQVIADNYNFTPTTFTNGKFIFSILINPINKIINIALS